MVDFSVTNARPTLKKDGYPSVHESMCAKLQQARTIADVASKGDLAAAELMHLVWCIADLLDEACDQCENLTAQDFEQAK